MEERSPKSRVQVRRHPERGRYDREAIDAILDEAIVAHVGFVKEGQPFVIPMAFVRIDDEVFLHGSAGSRLTKHLRDGAPLAVTVTLLDGLVLARSVFNSSMNYRSVVVLGVAREISDLEEKREAMRRYTERLMPGRWGEVRPPKDKELKTTTVLAVPLDEASAKVRTGPPIDEPEDADAPVWAGVLPLRMTAGEPLPDEGVPPGTPLPRTIASHDG
jgi:hypothetical protein